MPVNTITKDDYIVFWQKEVGQANLAKRFLCIVGYALLIKLVLEDKLYVSHLFVLISHIVDAIASVTAKEACAFGLAWLDLNLCVTNETIYFQQSTTPPRSIGSSLMRISTFIRAVFPTAFSDFRMWESKYFAAFWVLASTLYTKSAGALFPLSLRVKHRLSYHSMSLAELGSFVYQTITAWMWTWFGFSCFTHKNHYITVSPFTQWADVAIRHRRRRTI
jgi:hypothetical protein